MAETPELKDLLVDRMEELLHAENQLVKALPKLAKAAHAPQLREAFQTHLQETNTHLERLRQGFELLGAEAKPRSSKGMQGLIDESEEAIHEGKDLAPAYSDLALIIATQKIKHYEISSYGSLRMLAERMGESRLAQLLGETRDDEKRIDEMLSRISDPLFVKAA